MQNMPKKFIKSLWLARRWKNKTGATNYWFNLKLGNLKIAQTAFNVPDKGSFRPKRRMTIIIIIKFQIHFLIIDL